MTIKAPIEANYIDISSLIQHLYTKIILNKDKENLISKSFDIFDQIIRLTPLKKINILVYLIKIIDKYYMN